MKKSNFRIFLFLIITVLLSVAILRLLNKRTKLFQNIANSESVGDSDIPLSMGDNSIEQKKIDYAKNQKLELEQGIERANVPIEFWGKVVDQNDQPIESVKIQYRIQQPRVIWDSHSSVSSITTDATGSFHIVGEKGSSFSFESFIKNGYKKAKGQKATFMYSDDLNKYIPDKSNPEVYTMIKEGEMQGLTTSSMQLMLEWNGVPVRYNLQTGKFDSSGEIQITARRGEIKGKGRQARYDWSFEIQAIKGGILEISRGKAYMAPVNGYNQFWEYGYLATDPQWRLARNSVHLVFQLPGGNYGRLELDINAELESKFSGRISSYLNPSGGRLLEYEASLKIK